MFERTIMKSSSWNRSKEPLWKEQGWEFGGSWLMESWDTRVTRVKRRKVHVGSLCVLNFVQFPIRKLGYITRTWTIRGGPKLIRLFSILSIRSACFFYKWMTTNEEKKGEEKKKDSYLAYETDVAIKSL